MNRTQLRSTGQPFVFTNDNLEKINHIKKRYPPENSASAVMPVLWLAQQQHYNWISQEVVKTVASTLNLPLMRVYEVVTFYTMYNIQPVGQYHVQVCRTTPCWLRGSENILSACLTACGVEQTNILSTDQKFFVSEVECLGACANAPMIQVNDTYYEDLTPQKVTEILMGLPDTNDITSQLTDRHNIAPAYRVNQSEPQPDQAIDGGEDVR